MSFQMHCLKDKTKLSFECGLRLGFTSIVNTRCTTRNCKHCLRRNSIFSSNLLFSAPPPLLSLSSSWALGGLRMMCAPCERQGKMEGVLLGFMSLTHSLTRSLQEQSQTVPVSHPAVDLIASRLEKNLGRIPSLHSRHFPLWSFLRSPVWHHTSVTGPTPPPLKPVDKTPPTPSPAIISVLHIRWAWSNVSMCEGSEQAFFSLWIISPFCFGMAF